MINLPHPLWKTCRIIACETRLNLLRTLINQGELCVYQLMEKTGMSRPNTSNQLRLLSECGLIVSRRENMNVIYRAEANTAMAFAPALLSALERGFSNAMSFEKIIHQATAVSHNRRIEIIQAFKGKRRTVEELENATGMSSSALSRHLLKLERRGFVLRTEKHYQRGKPGNTLGRVLLKLASASAPPARAD